VSLLASYCILYSLWCEAALDVEVNGQTLTVISTTRTGRREKPITNPAVRNVKFGLNPLDRPRVEAPVDAKDENGNDPFDDFLGRTTITFTGHSNPLQTSSAIRLRNAELGGRRDGNQVADWLSPEGLYSFDGHSSIEGGVCHGQANSRRI